jgi:aquaporin Z
MSEALRAVRAHWPEYLMEAAGLALILLVSCAITAIVETRLRPGWSGGSRRAIEGLTIATTLVSLIYSPWGRRSGAHFNPAVTLTFLALRRVQSWDAAFYTALQFVGAVVGILIAGYVLGPSLREAPVTWIVTQPGVYGAHVAFAAEFAIAFILMSAILWVGGNQALARFTGLVAGGLVFLYVCFEAPLSGFSMNPARTFASAAASGMWSGFWIYVIAPPAGMLTAACANRLVAPRSIIRCAKLIHDSTTRCIHCGFVPAEESHV